MVRTTINASVDLFIAASSPQRSVSNARVSTVSPAGSSRKPDVDVQRQCRLVAFLRIDHRPMHVVAAHPTQAVGQEPGTDAVTESIRVDGEPLDIAAVTGTTEDAVAGDLIDRSRRGNG